MTSFISFPTPKLDARRRKFVAGLLEEAAIFRRVGSATVGGLTEFLVHERRTVRDFAKVRMWELTVGE